jgi:formate/nitrite transporter
MAPIPTMSLCLTPNEAYMKIVKKGEDTVAGGWLKCFHQAFVGGCYIGFGGLLSMAIAGQIPGATPGTQKFVFAALFPVNLLLILLTGGSLFTGNTAAMPAAVFEGKTHWGNAVKYLVVSWVGNFLAAAMFAALTDYAELCPNDYPEHKESYSSCGYLAVKVVEKKVASSFGQNFVKGIMCNWMVCMAVFLSSQAQDMTGKMVGIWFPISAFVAMGMEHSVANMFMLPMGLIAGGYMPDGTFNVTFGDCIVKNMIPVSLGNFAAGAVCVAMSYSFAFGKLGQTQCGAKDKFSYITTGCNCMAPNLMAKKFDDTSTTEQPHVHSTPRVVEAVDVEMAKP